MTSTLGKEGHQSFELSLAPAKLRNHRPSSQPKGPTCIHFTCCHAAPSRFHSRTKFNISRPPVPKRRALLALVGPPALQGPARCSKIFHVRRIRRNTFSLNSFSSRPGCPVAPAKAEHRFEDLGISWTSSTPTNLLQPGKSSTAPKGVLLNGAVLVAGIRWCKATVHKIWYKTY